MRKSKLAEHCLKTYGVNFGKLEDHQRDEVKELVKQEVEEFAKSIGVETVIISLGVEKGTTNYFYQADESDILYLLESLLERTTRNVEPQVYDAIAAYNKSTNRFPRGLAEMIEKKLDSETKSSSNSLLDDMLG